MSTKIALAQMDLLLGEPDHNFQKAEEWIKKASNEGADLILLPELWASGFDLKNCQTYAAPLNEGDFARMKQMAVEKNIMVGGSLIEQDEDNFYNTFVIFDKNGDIVDFYRKVHLFRMLNEEQYLTPGNRLKMSDTDWGKIGLATCYDLRFPDMFRAYAVKGVEIILIVAEWGQKRISHWCKLLRARAIENQCFVAAVNKSGISQGENLGGFSAVINPMGEYLAQGNDQEELLFAEINLEEVVKTRRWMPVFEDRQPQVYNKFLNE